MKSLPTPDVVLREARDFIFSSALARKALEVTTWPRLPVLLQDLLTTIHELVLSCHMPEFTDHGLPHLASLVDRLSQWQNQDDQLLVEKLNPEESAILLLATLVHDLGMLSQNPDDLPVNSPTGAAQDQSIDIAEWVRRTHVTRLPRLAARVLRDAGHDAFVGHNHFNTVICVAAAHQSWPWEWTEPWANVQRHRGLAAAVAVADLLDEDDTRCDTTTLVRHRSGSALNRAHWLRHGLTMNRVLVTRGCITVEMHKPINTDDTLLPVFGALRNHFRLVNLYGLELRHIGSTICNIQFDPCTGIPAQSNGRLDSWHQLPAFETQNALCFQLLRSFLGIALRRDPSRLSSAALQRIRSAGLEDIDLTILDSVQQAHEPRTDIENAFHAIAGGMP